MFSIKKKLFSKTRFSIRVKSFKFLQICWESSLFDDNWLLRSAEALGWIEQEESKMGRVDDVFWCGWALHGLPESISVALRVPRSHVKNHGPLAVEVNVQNWANSIVDLDLFRLTYRFI